MPKPKIPNQRKANLEHKKRTERYSQLIQQVYDKMALEAVQKASIAGIDLDKPFSFADYPMTRTEILKLQSRMRDDVSAIIMAGTSAEWKESNLVQDLVARKVLTAYTGTTKHGEEYTRYFQTNPEALKAFQSRRDEGMNLSTRVWNLSQQYKTELEESITAAIAPGMSAVELAAKVKKYLNEPDKRFRRIKEKAEDGTIKWNLSNNAKAYHPGRGVYRSSARNAQRLARTEINMAYRTAEQTRWRQFDFVVGYEVHTTQNGHHVEDICDQLAGKYPKDFEFKGWHPNCMCYAVPILKTEAEFWADDSENSTESVNEVTEVPEGFKDWIKDNEERIERAGKRGTLPYFIKDNREVVDDVLYQREGSSVTKTQTEHIPMEVESQYGGSYLKPLSEEEKLNSIIELTGATREEAEKYLDSVESFSHGWDYEIREYQRTGNVATLKDGHTLEEVKSKAKILEEFLAKSPQWISPTYRGMGLSEEEYQEMLLKLKDGTFDMRGSASWSSEIKDANRYAYDNRWDSKRLVVFECEHNGRATSIRHLSLHPDENEVLVSNGVKYRMIGEPIEDKLYGRTPVIRIKLEAIDAKEYLGNQFKPHYGAAMKLGRSATKEAMKVVENIGVPELTDVQKANIRELAQTLGISRKDIKPMSYLDADQGRSNPTKDDENCQSVVVAFEARRRGLNVFALPYSADPNSMSYALGERFQDAWLNPKTGKVIEPIVIKGSSDEEIIAKLKKQLKNNGRYVLGINFKDGRGHVVSVDVISGKIVIKDEQLNTFTSTSSIEKLSYLEVLKIDQAIFNIDKVKSILGL